MGFYMTEAWRRAVSIGDTTCGSLFFSPPLLREGDRLSGGGLPVLKVSILLGERCCDRCVDAGCSALA